MNHWGLRLLVEVRPHFVGRTWGRSPTAAHQRGADRGPLRPRAQQALYEHGVIPHRPRVVESGSWKWRAAFGLIERRDPSSSPPSGVLFFEVEGLDRATREHVSDPRVDH